MSEQRTTITPANFPQNGKIRASGPLALWNLKGYHIHEITIHAEQRTGDKPIQLLQDSACDGMVIDTVILVAKPDESSKQSWMNTDYLGISVNSKNVQVKHAYAEKVHIPLKLMGVNSQCNYLQTLNTSGDGFQVCGDAAQLKKADIHGLLDVYPYEMDHSDVGMLFPARGRTVLNGVLVKGVRLWKSGHKWQHKKPQGILAPDQALNECSVVNCDLMGVHEEHGVRFGYATNCTISGVKTDGDIAFGCRKNRKLKGHGNQVDTNCEARSIAFEDGSDRDNPVRVKVKEQDIERKYKKIDNWVYLNKLEHTMFTRKVFFDSVRGSLFGGSLTNTQVEGIEAVLSAWELQEIKPSESIAYSLATVFHETGKTMQPIKERGGNSYFTRLYDITGNKRKALELGNCTPGDGAKYCGRGLPQLTGLKNYLFQGNKHGLDLVNNPDLMLQMDVSAKVLVSGMVDGDFTGKSLDDCYDENGVFDPLEARRVINGNDCDELIKRYHERFLAAIYEASEQLPEQSDTMKEANLNDPSVTQILTELLRVNEKALSARIKEEVTSDLLETIKIKRPEEMPNYYDDKRGTPMTQDQPKGLNGWLSGKKTHLGMLISGSIGIAGMFGFMPGISPEAGAAMLQSAFAISGTRSALPKLIIMGITHFANARAR